MPLRRSHTVSRSLAAVCGQQNAAALAQIMGKQKAGVADDICLPGFKMLKPQRALQAGSLQVPPQLQSPPQALLAGSVQVEPQLPSPPHALLAGSVQAQALEDAKPPSSVQGIAPLDRTKVFANKSPKPSAKVETPKGIQQKLDDLKQALKATEEVRKKESGEVGKKESVSPGVAKAKAKGKPQGKAKSSKTKDTKAKKKKGSPKKATCDAQEVQPIGETKPSKAAQESTQRPNKRKAELREDVPPKVCKPGKGHGNEKSKELRMTRKCVGSRAYHHALEKAKREGRSEDAKEEARLAHREAVEKWDREHAS